MTYYLPSPGSAPSGNASLDLVHHVTAAADMTDLKVFWGPDICRLEYLVHLVDTGRIKDERVSGRSWRV